MQDFYSSFLSGFDHFGCINCLSHGTNFHPTSLTNNGKEKESSNDIWKAIIGSEFCILNVLEQSNVNSKHMLCLDFCFKLILRQCTVLFTPEIFLKKLSMAMACFCVKST